MTNQILVCVVPTIRIGRALVEILEESFLGFLFTIQEGTADNCAVGRFVVYAERPDGKRIRNDHTDNLCLFARGALTTLKRFLS